MERQKIIVHNYFKLIIISILVGLSSATLAFSLKHLTEIFEEHIFNEASKYSITFIVLPSIGITAIYYLLKNERLI